MKPILVTGGTGFVGRHVVGELTRCGHRVRVVARKPEKAARLQQATGCEVVAGDVLDPESIRKAAEGVSAVVHLVGIIFEQGKSTFERIHVEGTRNVVEAAKAAGATRYLQMSAIGSRALSPSRYHRTKWEAEEIVRNSGLDWTIFQPSVIYGRNDQFVQLFSALMEAPLSCLTLNCLPLFFDGKPKMQPVPVTCVAGAFGAAVARPAAVGKTYELCGPQVELRKMISGIAEAKGLKPVELHTPLPVVPFYLPFYLLSGRRPVLVGVPGELARIGAWVVEHFSPVAIMNSDQMLMLQEDQEGDPGPARSDLGIEVPVFEGGISFLRE